MNVEQTLQRPVVLAAETGDVGIRNNLSQRGAEEPESLALEGLDSGVVIEAGPTYGRE